MLIHRRQALAGGVGLLTARAAFGQVVVSGGGGAGSPGGFQRLYQTTTSVGNGADTTEDVLQTYTLPVGMFSNIGDTVLIQASGTLGATTDSKVMRIKAAATAVSFTPTATLATQTQWRLQTTIQKRGATAQTVDSIGSLSGASGTTNTQSIQITANDTIAMIFTITGQNSTSSVAGSITCQFMTVDFVKGV